MPATPSPRDQRAAKLWRDGLTYRQIGSRLGIEPNAVAAVLHRLRRDGADLPARKAPPWSAHDDALVIAAASAGQAADVPGRTPAAVEKRLRDLRAAGRAPVDESAAAWTAEIDELVITGYCDGRTLEQLAADVDRTAGAVFDRLERLREGGADLPPRKPRWTAAERERLADRYREGATYRQLTIEFGRTHGTISRQLRQLRDAGAIERRQP